MTKTQRLLFTAIGFTTVLLVAHQCSEARKASEQRETFSIACQLSGKPKDACDWIAKEITALATWGYLNAREFPAAQFVHRTPQHARSGQLLCSRASNRV
jgi:hypothetical protein